MERRGSGRSSPGLLRVRMRERRELAKKDR
jgi:hypothetical protein